MRLKVRLILLLCVTVNVLFAQTNKYQWQTITAAGYTYKTVPGDPMKTRFYTLKNGLSVILTVTKKEPRIKSIIAVRAGSNNDPSTHTGLAHYLEHLMFKGTDKYGTQDWAKEKPLLEQINALYEQYNSTTDTLKRAEIYRAIDSVSGEAAKYAIPNEYEKMLATMGGQDVNASTWYDYTNYLDDIPSNAIDKYLTVQAERFRDPVFRLFHTELEAVYEEKNSGIDSDPEKVYELMYSLLFPNSNYGKQTTIGTIEHLKNPSLVEIRKFYNTYYVPNNMAIIMAGDFDPDIVIKKVEEKLGYMQPKPFEVYQAPKEEPIAVPINREVLGPDAESVSIGFRMPGESDTKAKLILLTLKSLLVNGKAGLIDLDLNKRQLVLGASVGLTMFRDVSEISLSARPKADQTLDQVKELLLAELVKLKKGDFEESLIKATVANYKFGQLQAFDNYDYRADVLFNNFIVDRNASWTNEVGFLEAMSKLTKKDIVDFANKYFAENYVCIYKRTGEDKNVVKVVKPPITPLEINRDTQSVFLQKVDAIPAVAVKPQWLDYNKDFSKTTIANTEFLYVQNKDNDIFRLSYRFDMGSYNNRILGLAAQYLQYLSTDKLTAEDISKQFYNLACSYNISVGTEFTTISLTGLNENMLKASALMENILVNCVPDENALATLKARLMKARADNKLNKDNISRGLYAYARYGAVNPFNNQLTNAELEALKADNLIQLLHTLTKYKHTVIYYGPLTSVNASAAIKKHHVFSSSYLPYPQVNNYEKLTQTQNTILFADYDMVQADVTWVRNTEKFNVANEPVIELFNEYYGANMSSVVFQVIREAKALAYNTYAGYFSPLKKDDRCTMYAYIACQADKLTDAMNGMNDLLNNIPESEKSLELSRKAMKSNYETARYIQDQVIYEYLADKRLGLQQSNRRNVYNSIDKIEFTDFKKLAKQNISNKPYTYCIVASEKKININQLSAYGEVKKLSLEEIFGY